MNDLVQTTIKRVISAVVALPIYAFAIITDSFQSIPILIASLLISLICLYEFYQISSNDEKGKPFIAAGMVTAVVINVVMYLFAFGKVLGYSQYIQEFDARVIMGIITLLLTVILVMQVFKRPIKGGIYSVSVTLFGLMFIVFSFSHIILIKGLKDGVFYILLLNIIIMLNDVGAYFGGVLFGKHKTNFPVSPNKSWEGYFSGVLFSIIGIMVLNQIYISFFSRELFSMIGAVILGIIISILGSVGDLVESAVKRDGEIKDSGSIIPGHGGMWDVFDAMIFAMPIFYYYLVLMGVR